MKHGRKPTVAQRKYLQYYRLNDKNWLVIQDTLEQMVIQSRETGKIRKLPGRPR